MNFPSISDPNAMLDYPDARSAERDELLEMVELRPGQKILDIQAAGGFLSDEIYRRLAQDVRCVCIEPCEELGRRLNPRYDWIRDPMESFCSVDDFSMDIVIGLAGLHHSRSHRDTIQESFRVLKAGGKLAICDVEEGSNIAAWLNHFVDRHNPSGHSGNFLRPGDAGKLLEEAGFGFVTEKKVDVPWKFERKEELPVFFKGLFGLALDIQDVERAIEDYFNVQTTDHAVSVDWQLIYFSGIKPVG